MPSNQVGELVFSIDSRLLFELGEQLVARPSIALAELVKNAYDADATQVKVAFNRIDKPNGVITISDNGNGMTFEEIENGWMRIAGSAKRTYPKSFKYNRPQTGAKGIGRFATRRLGRKLKLRSVVLLPNGTKEVIFVYFNWDDFLIGKDLTTVPIKYRRTLINPSCEQGVTLKIFDANDIWDDEDIDELKRNLFGLISPFPLYVVGNEEFDDPGFNISINVGTKSELTSSETDLTREFLESAWALLSASINDSGRAEYTLDFLRSNESPKTLVDDSESYPFLKNASLRIYFHQYEIKENYAGLSFSLRDAQKMGREQGGVRVYLDNFRIYPYGEVGDDWLGLADVRSRNVDLAASIPISSTITNYGKGLNRPFLMIPGNNQLFGFLTLSQQMHANSLTPINERLNIKASREGFVENQVFEQLRRFVLRGIYWLTLQYAAFRAITPKKSKNSRKSEESIAELKQDISNLPNRIADIILKEIDDTRRHDPANNTHEYERQLTNRIISAIAPEIKPITQNLQVAEQSYKTEQEELIGEISMLRLLASVGTSLVIMNHQFSPIVHTASGIKYNLLQLKNNLPQEFGKDVDNIYKQVEEWQIIVDGVISPLASLLNPEHRTRRRRLLLFEVIEETRRALEYYMKEHQVDFINDVPQNLRTPPIYRAELYAILLNLLTNALKAVYGFADRKIKVEAYKSLDKNLVFRMLNTGKKAPKDMWDQYFLPFMTDSISDSGLGVGTGLGLAIIRDMTEEYLGSARFVEVSSPWQTGLEIILPDRGDK